MSEHFISVRNEETISTTSNPSPGMNFSDRSSFTIHAAKAGSSMGNNTTKTGHVFLEINTPGYRGSIGFSPGEKYDTSRDNISLNDREIYKETSSHRFELPSSPKFDNMMNILTAQVKGYASGAIEPGDYNLLFNNCIHFVEKILDKAGIKIDLATTPDGVAKEISKVPEKLKTPLLIDLDGSGITTLPIEQGVEFDFDGESQPIHTGWAGTNSGFLVMDRNKDGIINDGKELFGDRTPLPNGGTAPDGVIALAALDSNLDGFIDKNDSVWADLKIWQDINSNGISEANELQSLIDIGLKNINLSFTRDSILDKHGNIHELNSSVTWNDGRVTDISDVLFKVLDPKASDDVLNFISQDFSIDVVGSRYTAEEVYS
ncbi:hypothetical protein J4P02_20195 [Pseudomonas sp. NFXW11]|uniref:hypothetical protein n=1 Tax=Pseudomonas sp. NFXW11 TaxID=2819531 RepID=UPI003CE905C9